jgi:hypothetical protein
MSMTIVEQEAARWISLVKTNQPVAKASCYHTLETSTNPTNSPPISGPFVLISAAGTDHLVSFSGDASTSSAVVPNGAVMQFEIADIANATTISVRTISGTGYCTIFHTGSDSGDPTSWML